MEKKGINIKTSFSLLSTGINFHVKKNDLTKETQLQKEASEKITQAIFPDLTKEKSEIDNLKAQLSKIAKSDLNPEKKEKLIKEKSNALSDLKSDFYTKLRLTSSNYDVIDPMASFEEMQKKCKLRPKFYKEIIEEKYHFKNPSPIQSVVIPLLIEKRNVVASSETGSGKTLSYLIPLVHNSLLNKLKDKPNKALIVLPTKELAKQIYNETIVYCKYYADNDLKTKYVNKGMLISIKDDYSNFLINNDIFIATPNNILNLLNLCGKNLIDQLLYLVLDEADKFFDFGFSDIIYEILALMSKKTKIVKCFFSATLLESIGEIITTQIFDSVKIAIGLANIPARHIEQEFTYCSNEDGKLIGIKNIFKNKVEFPILIFVEGIKKLKAIYECIRYEIQKISYIHSKMTKQEREEQITKFRLGETWVLICSDLLARGVDFKNVKTVINYDCPYRPVNYIHRIGRTGRAGKKGKAITFVIDDDVPKLKKIARMINTMVKDNKDNLKCPNWLINLGDTNKVNNTKVN